MEGFLARSNIYSVFCDFRFHEQVDDWFEAVHEVGHANFDPLPLSHFVTHPGTSPETTSHISDNPPSFSRPSTKTMDKSPLYKFYLNCSRRFLSGGLSGLVFVHSPFCRPNNTSFT